MQRVCFIHIPKTAGTAVTNLLEIQYPKNKVLSCIFMHEYKAIDPTEFEQYFLYKGHVHLDFAKQHFPSDTKYVTVFREPVERVFSQYFYIRKTGKNFLEQNDIPDGQRQAITIALNYSINDYLLADHPGIIASTQNQQIRAIIGKDKFRDLRKEPENLAKAAYNEIADFTCVGVQEFLPFFGYELGRQLNLPSSVIPTINVNKHKFDQLTGISKDELNQARDIIIRFNEAELMFYEMIRKDVQTRINDFFVTSDH